MDWFNQKNLNLHETYSVTERSQMVDKYNNRPPFRKFLQNINGNKDPRAIKVMPHPVETWKFHISPKKSTRENLFIGNYQHKAFLENLQSTKHNHRPHSVSGKLPTIPYLSKKPFSPMYPSEKNNLRRQLDVCSLAVTTNVKSAKSENESAKAVAQKFQNIDTGKKGSNSNNNKSTQSLSQIQEQLKGLELKLNSKLLKSERSSRSILRKSSSRNLRECQSKNSGVLCGDVGVKKSKTVTFVKRFMGNIPQKESTESCKTQTTESSFTDEKFFKKSVVDKAKYFEKFPPLKPPAPKLAKDYDPKLKKFVVEVVKQEVQRENCKNVILQEIERENRRRPPINDSCAKRPMSAMAAFSCGRQCPRGCNSRSPELFHPDYNFGSKCVKKAKNSVSLIDSIREKVFQYKEDEKIAISYELDNDGWSDDYSHFPKETRNAIATQLSREKSSRKDGKELVTVSTATATAENVAVHAAIPCLKTSETQTSPVVSTTRVYPAFKVPKLYRKIPCTKNLLCEKGLHVGKCGRTVAKKQKVLINKKGRYKVDLTSVPHLEAAASSAIYTDLHQKRVI